MTANCTATVWHLFYYSLAKTGTVLQGKYKDAWSSLVQLFQKTGSKIAATKLKENTGVFLRD